MLVDESSMKIIALTAIAGLGGALSYMWREVKAGRPLRLFRVALSSCMVAFICFHLGFIYEEFGLSTQMVWAINGFTAVIGVEAMMTLVSRIVFKILRVSEDDIAAENLIRSGWTPPAGKYVSRMEQTEAGKQTTSTDS